MLRLLAAGVIVGALPVFDAHAQAADVTSLRLERSGDNVYLNALLAFELPPLVLEVLDKGIAVFFIAEAELLRERWYWSDRTVAQASRYLRLAYQPLTRRWRLNEASAPMDNARLGVAFNQNYDTLEEALDAVKHVTRLPLGDVSDLGDQPVYPVVFRFRLDTSLLPRALQIGASGNADWNMKTERSARLALEPPP